MAFFVECCPLLFDNEYKQKIRDFWLWWKTEKHKYTDIGMWWDMGKIGIKDLSREYSTIKSLEQKIELEDLEFEIDTIKDDFSQSERLNELKLKYD